MANKRKMSLSLDLDNKWSYLRTFGNDDWRDLPSYLDVVCPRILDFFEARDAKITFFIVGKDAEAEENREAIRSLADAGHEIGSHSYFHEPWLHLYTREELNEDLEKAEAAIRKATGVTVRGFRGPGFSITETVLQVLRDRGYTYDATAFPNILNPLSRAYLFARTELSSEEREKRKALFGSFSDALRPVKPYQWEIDHRLLVEIPVTTMPLFKTPIHFSYLIYLGSYSRMLARLYLRIAITMCKVTGTEPSLLLHPLDFMGHEDDSDLSSFPGMNMSLQAKLELMGGFVDTLMRHFDPITMAQHVERVSANGQLRRYEPTFSN